MALMWGALHTEYRIPKYGLTILGGPKYATSAAKGAREGGRGSRVGNKIFGWI
jgi:hypothetical protein